MDPWTLCHENLAQVEPSLEVVRSLGFLVATGPLNPARYPDPTGRAYPLVGHQSHPCA